MPDPNAAKGLYRFVQAAIAARAGVAVMQVCCKAKLADPPMNLLPIQRAELAPPFQDCAQTVKSGAVVTAAETEALEDVIGAYNLVGTRAGLNAVNCGDPLLPPESCP